MGKSRSTKARKWASLTALGAATLAAGASEADATVVFVNYNGTPVTVGFSNGDPSSAPIIQIFKSATLFLQRGSNSTRRSIYLIGSLLDGGGTFRSRGGVVTALSAGQTRNQATGRGTDTGVIAKMTDIHQTTHGKTVGQVFNNLDSVHRFVLFSASNFRTAGPSSRQFVTGWVDVSVDVNGDISGPDVTVHSYAYQPYDPNNPLPAGITGSSVASVPEPSSLSLELTALATFVAGGPALRRWRQKRRAARAA